MTSAPAARPVTARAPMPAEIDLGDIVLRPPVAEDEAGYLAFCASDRAAQATGLLDEREGWRRFLAMAGHWPVYGFGFWMVSAPGAGEGPGAALGFVGLHAPPFKALPELGWVLYPEAEGRGIATRAGRAALDAARASGRFPDLASYIIEGNTRSEALAARLGARRGRAAAHAAGVREWVYDMGGRDD
ncbi:MAG: GNAT family N-acetyltransferase [Pseudomonadota bacterium]